ncbi:hypothetical protein EGW08_020926, partial [Elysia chlorotica]
MRVVGLLASFWAIPVITWEPVLRKVVSDKNYDNVFSVYGAFEDFAWSAAAVIKRLKWTKLALLYEASPLCSPLVEQLEREMLGSTLASEASKNVIQMHRLGQDLSRIKTLTRTVVICSGQSTLVSVMAEADKAGMTSGYYAFLHLNFDPTPLPGGQGDGQRSPLDVVLQLGQFHPEREQ